MKKIRPWPTLESRTAKEQNKIEHFLELSVISLGASQYPVQGAAALVSAAQDDYTLED